MQKCYNCGKEVDDNVLICPDCGALVKRYGKPESAQPEQEADPFPRETAFDTQPQPRGAVWQQEDGNVLAGPVRDLSGQYTVEFRCHTAGLPVPGLLF